MIILGCSNAGEFGRSSWTVGVYLCHFVVLLAGEENGISELPHQNLIHDFNCSIAALLVTHRAPTKEIFKIFLASLR
jgi:hypothetical protein